jgi:hypothetical protein
MDIKQHILKPETEITLAAASVALVYGVFGMHVPNAADVRADASGNVNTYKSVKQAVYVSTAAVAAIALLAHSPSVMVVGGGAIVIEAWMHHYNNFGVNGTEENAVSGFFH